MGDALAPDRLLAVIETQNEIASTDLDLTHVMERVALRAQELVGSAAAVVELFDEGEMVYCAATGTASDHVGLRLSASNSLSGLCVALGEVLYCADCETDDRVDRDAARRVGAASMLCVPLFKDDGAVGVLKVYDPRANAFDVSDAETLRLLSGLIAAHMTHASDYQQQLHASRHDPLTGLPNRREFDVRLAAEAARARRYGSELTVCMLDLDGFKLVNDTFGHASGDEVLRAVARHLDSLRGEDAAYRLGGDEFALLLVGADDEGAELVVRRVADAVRTDKASLGVTLSYGVAMLDGGDPMSTVELADLALYEAKRKRSRPAEDA